MDSIGIFVFILDDLNVRSRDAPKWSRACCCVNTGFAIVAACSMEGTSSAARPGSGPISPTASWSLSTPMALSTMMIGMSSLCNREISYLLKILHIMVCLEEAAPPPDAGRVCKALSTNPSAGA